MAKNNTPAEFKEEQKFTQWWLWAILISIVLIPLFGIYKQLVLGDPFGTDPTSNTGLVILSICLIGLLLLFGMTKLKININHDGIYMHFFPFTKKRALWNEIEKAELINYGFIGGWGIRPWTKYGTVYNTKGNKGIAIELKSGKKFLIGTQKEAELSEILKDHLG